MGLGLCLNPSKRGYGKVPKMLDWEKEYREALQKDPDVKNFHDNLQADMGRVFDTLENTKAQDGLPLDNFKLLISTLAHLDGRLKTLILKNEEDIRKYAKLSALVEKYNQLNEETSKFYNSLSKWADRVNDSTLLLKVALGYTDPPPGKEKYNKCINKLSEFYKAQNLLDTQLSSLLDSLCEQHKQIWKTLEAERKKSAGKLKCAKAWRKFSNIIFAAAFAAVVICSMVAAVMAAAPLGAAIGAALPIGTVGECFNRRLKKYEKKMQVENDVIETMRARIAGGFCELKQIRGRVKGLEDIIRSILGSIDFYCQDEDHQKVAAEDIREKLPRVEDKIDSLKPPLDYIREKRQSVEDAMEEMKHKVDQLRSRVDLLDKAIKDNHVQVVLKNIGCDVSPVLQQGRNCDMKVNPRPTWCNDFIQLIKLFKL